MSLSFPSANSFCICGGFRKCSTTAFMNPWDLTPLSLFSLPGRAMMNAFRECDVKNIQKCQGVCSCLVLFVSWNAVFRVVWTSWWWRTLNSESFTTDISKYLASRGFVSIIPDEMPGLVSCRLLINRRMHFKSAISMDWVWERLYSAQIRDLAFSLSWLSRLGATCKQAN